MRTAKGNRIESISEFPVWSPDGTEIDFTGSDPDTFDTPKGGVWAVNVKTGALRMLFGQEFTVFRCTWSPDGRKLACIEHFPHEEDVELTVMNLDTSGMTRLTNNSSDEETWPDWGRARG